MADKAPFYGTMTIDPKALDDAAFVKIWKKALASYTQDAQEWGITAVYTDEDVDGASAYQISGKTDEGFDESVDTILAGSLPKEDAQALYKALSELGLTVRFDITEYITADDCDPALSHETCGIKMEKDRPTLVDAQYEDIPVTSAKLVDLGFAEESDMDDEELAVMVASSMPDGPSADDLVDAIEDLRNDAKHGGVFTAEETSDPETFVEQLEASYSDEMDVE